MPVKSKKQHRYIQFLKSKYKTQDKAPEKYKWAFKKDWYTDVNIKDLPEEGDMTENREYKRYKKYFENTYNLNTKYKLFNKLYFNNELPELPFKKVRTKGSIIAQVNYKPVSKKWIVKDLSINEIRFNDLTERNKDAVFIHEMIHVWVSIKGFPVKGNLHLGEFLKKAKEIEHKSGLNIKGRIHKDSDDLEQKYADLPKIDVYAVIKTYTSKFLKGNATSIDFYSNLDKAEKMGHSLAENNYFAHIFKITTNTPIIEYDKIKKNIDSNRGWVVYTNAWVKYFMGQIKEYPKYAQKIKVI